MSPFGIQLYARSLHASSGSAAAIRIGRPCCGLVHGAVTPGHVLIQAEDHGLRLIGWGHSVRDGQCIRTGPASYAGWYPPEVRRREPATPATDIYLAARCLVYLAGGDPAVLTGAGTRTLEAISAGAVFFGALTYIGNAPNFMVRSIASHRGVHMPGFIGYMGWSMVLMLPPLLLVTWVFFRP